MAKNTVEYFSARLGNGVINNAASEATLQELLRAYKGMADDDADDDDQTAESLISTAKAFGALKKTLGALSSGLSNTVSAGKNFAGMIARGESKLSSYSRFLQEDLIKKLPVVGESLGGLASIVTEGIATFEEWNDGLKEANKHGATFNYSIFSFKETALDMGLSTDELTQLIADNSEKLVALGGGTITKGMDNVAKLSARMFMDSDAVSTVLDRWGYTTYQQNEMLIDYYYSAARGKDLERRNLEVTSGEFLMYAGQLDTYQKLTGMNRNDRMKAAAAANQDISYKIKVGKLLPHQQAKMEMALNSYAMVFGSQAAELFKSRELNVQTLDDVAMALQIALGPGFEKSMDELITMAKSNVTPDVFEKYANETIGRQLGNSQAAYKRLEPLLKSAISGNENARRMVKALTPAMEFMLKQGGMSKDMQGQFTKMIEAAKKEQGQTDAFTDTLRKFQRAVMRVYRSFLKTLFPVFKDLAKEFKIAMVPEKIREWGKYLQQLAKDAWPHIQAFFQNLFTPEGMTMMGDTFHLMMDWLKFNINAYIRRSLEDLAPDLAVKIAKRFGWIQDSTKYEQKVRRIEEQIANNFRTMTTPGMKSAYTLDDTVEPFTFEIDGKKYVVDNLQRGAEGFFKYLDDEFAADSSASNVHRKEAVERILAERERRAAAGKAPRDHGADKFGGMTLLEREALMNVIDMQLRGFGASYFPLKRVLSDPELFERTKARNLPRISRLLERPEYAAEKQRLREQYPSTFVGMNTGTLGAFGSLFVDFGRKGTPATLHGNESVVTPKQLGDVVKASSQISVKDVVNRLNTNINRLIAMTKADINVERSKLRAMT
jgi:hypothetical protein